MQFSSKIMGPYIFQPIPSRGSEPITLTFLTGRLVNPIENLWGILARCVYANGRQFGNAEALKQEIVNEWRKIDQDMIKPPKKF